MEFESLINRYVGDEDVPVILGCTELPVLAEKIGVSKKCVDPISILAKVCVELGKR